MQIRQLEALQNMARSSGSKTIFGMSAFYTRAIQLTRPVPMNLAGMGAAGMEGGTAQQIASSGDHESGNTHHDQARINAEAGPGPATNAGLISQMANM